MVQIGIFANDGGRLAAQLQRRGHEFVGTDTGNAHADIRTASKCNALDEWVPHQRLTDDRALTRQHADDAVRHTRRLRDACQFNGHARRDFSWLEHHGTACRQGRSQLLRLAGNRGVPGRDRAHHAQRLVHAHGDTVAALRCDGVFMRLTSRCKKLKCACGAGYKGAGFVDGFAVVQPLQLGQLFAAFAYASGYFVQQRCPLMRFEVRPRRSLARMLGGPHGIVYILCGGSIQGCHLAAVMRVVCRVDRA